MFQIGFWELVVVAIVALFAFGPDKLPLFAKLAGRWLGKLKQTYQSIQQEWIAIENSSRQDKSE